MNDELLKVIITMLGVLQQAPLTDKKEEMRLIYRRPPEETKQAVPPTIPKIPGYGSRFDF